MKIFDKYSKYVNKWIAFDIQTNEIIESSHSVSSLNKKLIKRQVNSGRVALRFIPHADVIFSPYGSNAV